MTKNCGCDSSCLHYIAHWWSYQHRPPVVFRLRGGGIPIASDAGREIPAFAGMT